MTTATIISNGDWKKIVDFYVMNAPGILPKQSRNPVAETTSRFEVQKAVLNRIPSITYVGINPTGNRLYVASTDSVLSIFDQQLNELTATSTGGITVDIFFSKTTDTDVLLTQIGIMHPNDARTGSVSKASIDAYGRTEIKHRLLDTLPRPVQTIAEDFDRDGKMDYLVCGFGNKQGSFFWMRNLGNESFEQKMLRPFPGAIKSYVEDINQDGLPDIIALFAQADEGIFLFINKGNGTFDQRLILRFPPVNGSTFFELVDFNGDGRKDILYTCGDNADYSNVLKNYHGVYIFLNKGDQQYDQQFFFPMHGAFKALARDYDQDGDLDIAAISYFPDTINQPREGFVYLEQTSPFIFNASSIEESAEGRWIAMDTGDLDGDGDNDIVLGSLFLPNEAIDRARFMSKPSFLVLRNKTIGRNKK